MAKKARATKAATVASAKLKRARANAARRKRERMEREWVEQNKANLEEQADNGVRVYRGGVPPPWLPPVYDSPLPDDDAGTRIVKPWAAMVAIVVVAALIAAAAFFFG